VRKILSPILFLFIALFLNSCEPEVQAINFGQDGCSYCRMTIVDEFYGSEILTTTGKAYKFDSIECLTAFLLKEKISSKKTHDIFFTDFEHVGNLYPLKDVIFVQAKKLKSPMGLNLSAYRSQKTAEDVALLYFGEIMTWEQVQNFVESSWLK